MKFLGTKCGSCGVEIWEDFLLGSCCLCALGPPGADDLCPNTRFHRLDVERLKQRFPYGVLILGLSKLTPDREGQFYLVPIYRDNSWTEWHNTRTFGFATAVEAEEFAARQNGILLP